MLQVGTRSLAYDSVVLRPGVTLLALGQHNFDTCPSLPDQEFSTGVVQLILRSEEETDFTAWAPCNVQRGG